MIIYIHKNIIIIECASEKFENKQKTQIGICGGGRGREKEKRKKGKVTIVCEIFFNRDYTSKRLKKVGHRRKKGKQTRKIFKSGVNE